MSCRQCGQVSLSSNHRDTQTRQAIFLQHGKTVISLLIMLAQIKQERLLLISWIVSFSEFSFALVSSNDLLRLLVESSSSSLLRRLSCFSKWASFTSRRLILALCSDFTGDLAALLRDFPLPKHGSGIKSSSSESGLDVDPCNKSYSSFNTAFIFLDPFQYNASISK